jgi:hypothetical protein
VTKVALIFLALVSGVSGFSQSHPDSLNNNEYIQRYPHHFFLWPVLKQRALRFDVKNTNTKDEIQFEPNNSYSLGFGAYIFDLSFEVTFAIPINEKSKKIYGESKARDLQINTLSRKWGADLYWQKYQGFYYDDGEFRPDDVPYPQRSDITTRNFGFTGLYVFNDTKYSLRSAFNFSERQVKSGGSWLVSGTVNSFKLSADSAVIGPSHRDDFGPGSAFEELRYTTLSIAPGYAYNFIYRNFFASSALMLGPAHNWTYYKEEDKEERNDIRFNLYAGLRLGIGYSTDRFFAGVNFVTQTRAVRFEELQVRSSTSTFRMLIGYRFREFGLLKKNVWELPKELSKL